MEEFNLFSVLTLIGGLCLFIFGMDVMGKALERSAGNRLSTIIGKLTTNKFAGFLTGLGVTAVIQSSSATTVMVVGFVWSDLLTNLERVSDHCSNIAECVLETSHHTLNMHESVKVMKAESRDYKKKYSEYSEKYNIQ